MQLRSFRFPLFSPLFKMLLIFSQQSSYTLVDLDVETGSPEAQYGWKPPSVLSAMRQGLEYKLLVSGSLCRLPCCVEVQGPACTVVLHH